MGPADSGAAVEGVSAWGMMRFVSWADDERIRGWARFGGPQRRMRELPSAGMEHEGDESHAGHGDPLDPGEATPVLTRRLWAIPAKRPPGLEIKRLAERSEASGVA